MKKSIELLNAKILNPENSDSYSDIKDDEFFSEDLPVCSSIRTISNLDFISGGNGLACLKRGWSLPESNHTWSTGLESEIAIPDCPLDRPFLLSMRLVPFVIEHRYPHQRLQIIVNDKIVFTEKLTSSQTINVIIPITAGLGDQHMAIVFKHPDAVVVSSLLAEDDHRMIAVALSSIRLSLIELDRPPLVLTPAASEDTLADRSVMLDFESLGDNCEFGLVQRRAGADPLSLLRFSAVALNTLEELLQTRFSEMAKREKLRIEAVRLESGDEEYLVHHQFYKLTYHTFTFSSQMNAERVTHREIARLTLATRAMLDHLQTGDRIFVYRTHIGLSDTQIFSLHVLLRKYGPTTLFYVTTATHDHPAGTVEVIADGLMRGYMGSFAPYHDAPSGDDQSWLALCRCAHAYWKATARAPRSE